MEKEFQKKLSKTDLGLTNSNLGGGFTSPSGCDPLTFFEGKLPQECWFYDKQLNKNFKFYIKQNGAIKNNEVRLSRMTDYFRKKKAKVGDIINVYKVVDENSNESKYFINILYSNNKSTDLKEQFADWFAEKDTKYYQNLFKSDRVKFIQKLTQYENAYQTDFGIFLFSLNGQSLEQIFEALNENEIKEPGEMFTLSSKLGNHAPKAILGKNNYIKFIEELINGKERKVIIENKSLRQFAFDVFKKIHTEFGEQFLDQELTSTSNSDIGGIEYQALKFKKYFSSTKMLATFASEQNKESLTTGKSQRFCEENLKILDKDYIYFNFQWSHPKDSSSADYFELEKFITDWSNTKYKLEFTESTKGNKTDRIYKLIINDSMEKISTSSLNKILYGPPGTGKTFSTIDRVVKICYPKETSKDHNSNKIVYDRLCQEGQVIFTTFHQSMSYEDFIEGIKPIPPKSKSDQIQYEVVDGIFKDLCIQATDDIREIINSRTTKTSAELTFKRKYEIFIENIKSDDISIETKSGLAVSLSKVSGNGNMRLKTVEGTKDYLVSIKRLEKLFKIFPDASLIKNILEDIRDAIGGCHATLYYAALSSFIEFNKKLINEVETEGSDISIEELQLTQAEYDQLIPYVIVIDEINRGNVSAIFGELITLIEEDKRLCTDNALFIKLPYSKEDFIVPPNVHILGTMNTADRSVEALDTALRRRFVFEEMLPKTNLLAKRGYKNTGEIEGFSLENLLETINNRIEVLVDRDHTIGHAYLWNVKTIKDLKSAFQNKIIPLLQEYFFGNYKKMEMVIGSGFFDKEKGKENVQFAIENHDVEIDNTRYILKDVIKFKDPEMETALNSLMNFKGKENTELNKQNDEQKS